MLSGARLTAFAASTNSERTRRFYQGTLGLRLEAEDGFALVFDANGTPLRIQKVQEVHPPPFTVLGWEVAGIETTVRELSARGVPFERYSFLPQDALGIWTAPGGTKVAWFKDPDGNLLSLAESAPA